MLLSGSGWESMDFLNGFSRARFLQPCSLSSFPQTAFGWMIWQHGRKIWIFTGSKVNSGYEREQHTVRLYNRTDVGSFWWENRDREGRNVRNPKRKYEAKKPTGALILNIQPNLVLLTEIILRTTPRVAYLRTVLHDNTRPRAIPIETFCLLRNYLDWLIDCALTNPVQRVLSKGKSCSARWSEYQSCMRRWESRGWWIEVAAGFLEYLQISLPVSSHHDPRITRDTLVAVSSCKVPKF